MDFFEQSMIFFITTNLRYVSYFLLSLHLIGYLYGIILMSIKYISKYFHNSEQSQLFNSIFSHNINFLKTEWRLLEH